MGKNRSTRPVSSRGDLFSAILLGDSELGRRWALLRPEAKARFPGLKFKPPGNLHLTVVFIGKGWREPDLPRLKDLTGLPLAEPVELVPEVARVGRSRQVVALDLRGLPEGIQAQVVASKRALVAEGLKSPDAHDGTFRIHVTLAESRKARPGREQARELAAFEDWIAARLDLATLRVGLDPGTPTPMLLAGVARADSSCDYIEADSYLKRTRDVDPAAHPVPPPLG